MDQALEFEPRQPTPPRPPPTMNELLEQHRNLHAEIARMDPIYKDICPGIPPYHPNRGPYKLREAVRLTDHAKSLLDEALSGHRSRGDAYLEWQIVKGRCPHGIPIRSASHLDDCFQCSMEASRLNAFYQDDWAHNRRNHA